jgi:hypothetical protein
MNCAPIITSNATTSKQQHTCRNFALITCVSLLNQRLQLLRDLQNDFSGDVEMFNTPLIFILSHEEIGIPSGVSSLDPITNLLRHQQINIARKPKGMQNSIILLTFNQQSNTMCHEIYY